MWPQSRKSELGLVERKAGVSSQPQVAHSGMVITIWFARGLAASWVGFIDYFVGRPLISLDLKRWPGATRRKLKTISTSLKGFCGAACGLGVSGAC